MSAEFRGGLAVFSGPSGSGKTSVLKALLDDPRVHLSVSATTRAPRVGEQDGVDYQFMDEAEFLRRRDENGFVEWAEVHGRYYGTPAEPLESANRDRSRLMLLDIDVQGAAQLRTRGIVAQYVFVAPPSLDELRRRLTSRGTDAADVIERRLADAAGELAQQDLYDHVLVNAVLSETIADARGLLGLA